MTDFKHITNCIHCGAPKVEPLGGGAYRCTYCGDVFSADDITGYGMRVQKELAQQVSGAVSEQIIKQRERDIGNARQNLYAELKAEHISSYNVIGCCRKLKEYLPEDFQANTFEVLNSGSKMQINKCLDSIDEKGEGRYYIKDILDFMLRSLVTANVLSLKSLADRTLNGEEKTQYLNAIEKEAEKYNEGMYNPKIPRKAFIAYSSSDMQRVNEVVNYLEDSGISCFVALRNLRHGKGAVENYEKLLKEAMHSCKCFVLISSRNSRRLDCDAMDKELPYVRDYEPQVKRIEYIIDDYGSEGGAKTILKDFFGPSEQCRDKDDLVRRIFNATTQKQANVNDDLQKQIAEYKKKAEEAEHRRKELEEEYKKKEEELKKREETQRHEESRSERNGTSSKTFVADSVNANRNIAISSEQTSKKSSNVSKNQPNVVIDYNHNGESNDKIQTGIPSQGQINRSYPTLKNYDHFEFEIEGTKLKKYKGEKSQVLIPDGITSIGVNAFRYSSIKRIIIPNSVTNIEDNAFWCCNLESITIPCRVTTIGERVFGCCTSLKSITVEKGNKIFHSAGNNIIETASKTLVVGCQTSVIPNDGSVTTIGMGAFDNMFYLESIIIPNSITKICSLAFINCSLESLTIPNSVTYIGTGAFIGCFTIKSITVGKCNKFFHSAGNNIIETASKTLISGCQNSIIPGDGSVTGIADYAFSMCALLKSINIPSSITRIGGYAFDACSSLKSISIPNSVTSIDSHAFYECNSLESIIMSNNVRSIGENVFDGCSNLTIYCRFGRFRKPSGWKKNWNCGCKVVWGYKG